MKISFKIKKRDLIDFNIWFYLNKKSFVILWSIAFLVMILFIIELIIFKPSFDKLIHLLFPVFLIMLACVLFIIIAWRNIVSLYQSSKILNEQTTFSSYEKYFTIKSISSESKTEWKLLHSIGESKKHIYLFFSKTQAILIPKRAFINDSKLILFKKSLLNISKHYKIKTKGWR